MTSSSTLPTPTSHPVLFEPTSVNHSSLEALVASLAPSNSVSPSAPSVPTAPPDPDIVVIELRTSLTIFNYHAFYDTPIHDFRPTFVALPDGSLLAPPMNEDLQLARASLLMIGAYLLLASRNIIVSFGYIHRVKVKRKEIFYILFASQAIAPTPWISLLYAFFNTAVNCTTVNRLVISSTALSTWLLLTGIFGIKAYRCLSQSRIVLVTLVLLQLGSVAVVSIDLVRMTGSYRTPAGNCSAVPGSSDFLSVIMILIFVEAFFICCCFIRAVWTSSRFLAAQGRLTYRISLDGDKDEQVQVVPRPTPAANRGWWDYTPRASAAPPDGEISHLPHEQEVDHRKSLVVGDHRRSTVFSTITTFWATSPTVPRAPLTGRTPIPHAAQGRRLRRAVPFFGSQVKEEGRQVISPLPAAPPNGLLKGLKPRMLLFREVMRDEVRRLAVSVRNLMYLPSVVLYYSCHCHLRNFRHLRCCWHESRNSVEGTGLVWSKLGNHIRACHP
ncbi:hypothetical protein FA95DRAFT_202520 [Auriscalpium vulgare]|uniref:Uncharacterized protein n=1 Tax=Auriscalpium vulgare TaxID=40419 RepID=A0ACB8S6G4_9AGAM|nr:hypothetical protein FA95DRAFT_202520 [Auriscalpium vulgare]